MRTYLDTFLGALAVVALVMAGCATNGTVAEGDEFDDDFGGGPSLPAMFAEQVTPGDGASLYAANCSRCHQERWPTERTDAQWSTIMLHMRGICNLPGEDADAILAYLRGSN